MNRYFVVSLSLLALVVLLIYGLTGDEKKNKAKSMAAVKATLTITDDNPGGWKLRFQSVNIPPTYLTCTNFDLSGSFSVSLNAAGEAYFGSYKDAVNAAIAAAVSDAVTNLLATAGKRCEDDCYAVLSNEQAGSSGDANATAMVVLTQGGETTELCWPDPGNVPDIGIHITASAPGVAGWNISNLFAGMSSSNFIESLPDDPTAMANAISYALSDGVAGVVVGGTTTWIISSGGSSGDVQIVMRRASATSVDISVDGPFLSASTYFASYSTSADVAASTGSITFNLTSASTATNGWPSSFTGTWSHRPDLSIDQTLPLTNTGGETDVHTPSGDTASLTASGSMTIAISEAEPELVDHGFTSKCQHDYTYTNVDKAQRLCMNEMQLQTKGVPYMFPRVKPPRCRIQLRAT